MNESFARLHSYGFNEKRRRKYHRRCKMCGKPFDTTCVRRFYCGSPECEEKRYQRKLERKKTAWAVRHNVY